MVPFLPQNIHYLIRYFNILNPAILQVLLSRFS